MNPDANNNYQPSQFRCATWDRAQWPGECPVTLQMWPQIGGITAIIDPNDTMGWDTMPTTMSGGGMTQWGRKEGKWRRRKEKQWGGGRGGINNKQGKEEGNARMHSQAEPDRGRTQWRRKRGNDKEAKEKEGWWGRGGGRNDKGDKEGETMRVRRETQGCWVDRWIDDNWAEPSGSALLF